MAHRICRACAGAFCVAIFAGVVGAQPYGGQKPYPPPAGTTRPAYPPAYPPAAAATRATTGPVATLKQEELDQIVAPIALYPDSLLAQVLMASTYPLEVVQAERWVKQNASLKDSPDALNKLSWDPSVKSLLDFPQVLTMMSEKLDWTLKLGDAFIADQKAVMDAVQRLRSKAYAQGNLKTTSEQKVTVQPTTMPAPGAPPQVIVLESSSPSVVYVPTYNPTVVYGTWPYPAYPPAYYYPPSYVAGTALLSFGVGVACGAAWGHAWGNCNWSGGDVDVDINRNVNFNSNIDREKYKAERDARQTDRQGNRDTRQGNRQGGANSFQHDPSHRGGVSYRDQATSERYRGQGASQRTSQARDQYRGRADAGQTDLTRGGADAYRGGGGAGGAGAGAGAGAGRGSAYSQTGSQSRNSTGGRSSGFSGASSSGSSARAASNRGQTSRSSSSYSGSRSSGGGGGSRGGGGGRGGGRR